MFYNKKIRRKVLGFYLKSPSIFTKKEKKLVRKIDVLDTLKQYFLVLASNEFRQLKFNMGKIPNPLFEREERRKMATTKIWKVQKRLDHVIDYATNEEKTKNKFYKETQDNFYSVRQALLYATNPDKTEKKFYTTGINCEVEIKQASSWSCRFLRR